jgi:hypothetical protein
MILFLGIRRVGLLDLWGFGMKKNDRVFSAPPTVSNKHICVFMSHPRCNETPDHFHSDPIMLPTVQGFSQNINLLPKNKNKMTPICRRRGYGNLLRFL